MWRITKWCHFEQHELNGRDEGRDVGEIKGISPVLRHLYTKDFLKMTGEMNVFNKMNSNMEEKKLAYNEIPMGYPLCFNDECAKKACCMHYQARMLLPEGRHHGPAVYPTAWQDDGCTFFRKKQLVRKAWGFTHLYNHVPQRDTAEARRCVRSYFSGGCGPYYRYHHGENKLSPKQQADIIAILSKFGPTDGLAFDQYEMDWDFD